MPRANPAPKDPPVEEEQEAIPISAEDAIGPDARRRVPFAGLLAAEPHLRDELHTPQGWQKLLDAYSVSERI